MSTKSSRNYARGRAAEYRARDELMRRGYLVLRSAGSKGDFDLGAIHYESGRVLLVQVKSGDGLRPSDRLRFASARLPLGSDAELWSAVRGGFVVAEQRAARRGDGDGDWQTASTAQEAQGAQMKGDKA